MVKLVPPVRAETQALVNVVLQVTLNFVPSDESNVKLIWLLAVTEVVSTTTVVALAATTTLPALAEVHTAGAADEEQLVPLVYCLKFAPVVLLP
jgi:hypothetical protein